MNQIKYITVTLATTDKFPILLSDSKRKADKLGHSHAGYLCRLLDLANGHGLDKLVEPKARRIK